MQARNFLLELAEDAIRLRAAKDGHTPGSYDAQKDPEGYMTALLTALRHWCHERGKDWHEELAQSMTCFVRDLGLPEEPPAFGELACPACSFRGGFFTEVTEVVLRNTDGELQHYDQPPRWDDSSRCSCPICAHDGQVCEFRAAAERT